jgi:hypothetical protein
MEKRAYKLAVAFAVAFTVAHFISLPIGITFDGLQYINLADVIGSSQFPEHWLPPRAPLFPLTLKAAFYLVGRQALAPTLVSTLMGFGTIVVLATVARRICGYGAAAAVMVLIACYPTFVAYQHFVLTELGTTFFVSVVVALLVWQPRSTAETWQRSILTAAVLSVGYYWRETLQTLALIAAALHVISCLTQGKAFAGSRSGRRVAVQAALIIAMPYLAGGVWSHMIDNRIWKNMALRQGLFRQAFIPPSDAAVTDASFYKDAIQQSAITGNFYSGLRSDLLDQVLSKSCSVATREDPQPVFLRALRQYPSRYIAAAARTSALLAGLPGPLESENGIFRGQVLDGSGSKIADGPSEIRAQIVQQFDQKSTDCLVLRILRLVTKPYDSLVVVASLLTVFGLFWACATKDLRLVVICAVPLFYLAFYVAILDSIDRYAAPVYPAMLANCIILPLSAFRRWKARRFLAG